MRGKAPALDRRQEGAARGATLVATVDAAAPLFGRNERAFAAFAREIAGDDADALTSDVARDLAYAEFQLDKMRRIKAALIDWVWTFGSLNSALKPPLLTARVIVDWSSIVEVTGRFLKPPDVEATMPAAEPERTGEAITRALSALLKIDRYERRAATSRNRAVIKLREVSAMSRNDQAAGSCKQKKK